jgi:hypothetical protein
LGGADLRPAAVRLAALGDDAIQVRAEGSGHRIHRDAPSVMVTAIGAVVRAVRSGARLPNCVEVFEVEFRDLRGGLTKLIRLS